GPRGLMDFAAGLSEHPVTAHAVGEAVGQVLEGLGGGAPPDLALLFVTPPHGGAIEDAAAAVMATLTPGALLGCAAESVVGGGREVEQAPAVALWAGRTGPVAPFNLRLTPTPDGDTLTGRPEAEPEGAPALLVLADPFTFPADAFLTLLEDERPGLQVVGGLASGAQAPGGNRLVIDSRVVSDGAVAAFIGADVDVAAVVSQGCRPVGEP